MVTPPKLPRPPDKITPVIAEDSCTQTDSKSLRTYSISCVISLIAHVLLLIILGLFVIQNQNVEDPITTILDYGDDGGSEGFDADVSLEPLSNLDTTAPQVLDVTRFLPNTAAIPDVGLPNMRGASGSGDSTGSGNGNGDGVGDSLGILKKRLEREGAKTGAVQISLMWYNGNDLDLHVRCPSGEVISYRHKKSKCHGELDVDMNAGGKVSMEPVENTYWPENEAPEGRYDVFVHHFRNQGFRDPTQFQVAIKVDGVVRLLRGTVRKGQPPVSILSFNYPMTDKEIARAKVAEKGRMERSERTAKVLMSSAKKYWKSRPEKARPYLQKIVRECPETETAQQAATMLEEMAAAGKGN